MSTFGRLWRRAPVWRVCVVSAVAFAGLAAMFPPALPRIGLGGGGGGVADKASFHPQPTPAPTDYAAGHLLPDGAMRSGVIHVAGHDVALPAGSWQALGVARQGGPDQVQLDMLGRVENGRLTGLVLLASPTVMSGMVGPVGEPVPCADPGRLAMRDLPPRPNDGPLTHACWAVVQEDMKQHAAADGHKDFIGGALGMLGDRHVRVPDAMLDINLYASNDRGWQLERVLVPDDGGTIGKVRSWADRFLPIVRQGLEGGLTAADVPAAAARDPGEAAGSGAAFAGVAGGRSG